MTEQPAEEIFSVTHIESRVSLTVTSGQVGAMTWSFNPAVSFWLASQLIDAARAALFSGERAT